WQHVAAVPGTVLRRHLEAARHDRHRGELEFPVRTVPFQYRLSPAQAGRRRYQDLHLRRRNPILMTIRFSVAAIALAAALAAPAAAQVNGIGVTEPAIAIAGSAARAAAYQAIQTQFQAQLTQLQQQEQQRDQVMRQFDTNNDGQLSEEEQTAAQANTAAVQQLNQLNQTIAQAQAPILRARVYAIEQIAMQYSPAAQQVISEKQ